MKSFVYVTGSSYSSLGKGLATASLASLLHERGYKVKICKIDGYLNIDAGTLSPHEHSEVFVTKDGAEVDVDIGNYERFLGRDLTLECSITMGQVYKNVLNKERAGGYKGKTVQIIPHITSEIKGRVQIAASGSEVCFIEQGGSITDIEVTPFLQAIRQLKGERNEKVISIHLISVPYIKSAEEFKTKLAQEAVSFLRKEGLMPDIILCRSEKKLPEDIRDKIALTCGIDKVCVFNAQDTKEPYSIPLNYKKQGIDTKLLELLSFSEMSSFSRKWEDILSLICKAKEPLTIAIISKYIKLHDAHKSIKEALLHAGWYYGKKVKIKWIDSETSQDICVALKDVQGVILAGGFGVRGIEEMVKMVKYIRKNKIPLLGICLGLQVMAIEYARDVLKMEGANSTEFDLNTNYPVVVEIKKSETIGGTLRLGNKSIKINDNSKFQDVIGKIIEERHRHRFCINKELFSAKENELEITGYCLEDNIVEIMELKGDSFFVGVQSHIEFNSRPNKPHWAFKSFIDFCINNNNNK